MSIVEMKFTIFHYLRVLFFFFFFMALSSYSFVVRGDKSSVLIVDVRSFGARANDHRDSTKAFVAAWDMACKSSSSSVDLIIPRGEFHVGPLRFSGPCTNVTHLTVRVKGNLKASTDLSKYRSGGGWIEFGWINGLTLTGGGTFDGQGALAWPFNNCTTDSHCKLLPTVRTLKRTSLKFVGMNRTIVRRISSVNSKFFHMALVQCRDFKGTRLNITAPSDSPNTDGIHIERSSNVYFSRSHIATGDDCVSIGQGNSQITITSIKCGPGHGISVGSLGRYPNEKDVKGLVVRDCKMSGTTNGIRIKTWADSPGLSAATNMTFQNIIMSNVTNPIIIDQSYCPFSSCSSNVPSKVKLSEIYFKNIRGSSSSKVAVQLHCSEGMPCKKVYLENVHLYLASSSGDQNLEANLIDATEPSSSEPQTKNYKRWIRLSIYVFFVLFFQPLATILGRLYYENGGESTYVVTLLPLIGFPVLILFNFFSQLRQQPKSADTNVNHSPSFTTLASVYLCTGLILSAYAYLYAIGLLYLPVSTFSLILASQLAFTAFFSYFLNSQKFTPFIVNSLFLLTVSSALLVVDTESQDTTNVSRVQYVLGFICTLGASAGIGLLLSLIQLLFRKVFKEHTSSVVMDLTIYQSLVASCVVLIGLFASGEWRTLPSEMRNYKLGQVSYVVTLVSAAISWQVYTVGLVGLIFESSSVFSNSITAVGLPIVPVIAVIVFHDKMEASKIFSIVLAIWGFLSFVYQHYLDEKKLKTCNTDPVENDGTQTW
ncbi:hypothetical protein HID58_012305 [Brassica napus]|uniref:Polygalacturonase n=1 Tax=Brassica napus TaxID=3708 RepID=A0ABQ8E0Q4_BRANA|nr:hypothetical protein HID58_012305 [Brassica napus]